MQCWILFQLKPSQREKEHYVVISNEHSIIGAIPIDGSQIFYNMKYVICYNIVDLSSRTICDVLITEKPISVLSDLNQKHYRIYLAEHEAPEGQFKAVFSESKMKLENGRTFGCKKIDLSEYNPILFEPDNDFETLHTGFALGLDLFNIPSTREDAMLLFSTEEGPSTWTRCIFEDVLELPNQILNVTVG